MSCSFVFVLRVCERLTTHSLISFYFFELLSLLEKLFVLFFVIEVRLLLMYVSSFQRPTLAVTGYNINEGKDSFVNLQMSVIWFILVFPKNFPGDICSGVIWGRFKSSFSLFESSLKAPQFTVATITHFRVFSHWLFYRAWWASILRVAVINNYLTQLRYLLPRSI